MAMEERLQNILSHRGVASRRGAAAMIEEGRVTVNGTVVREPGAYTVYELETSGKRLGTVPAEVKDGKLSFTASVDGPYGARMLHEVVKK